MKSETFSILRFSRQPSHEAIGYQELARYVQGTMPLDEAVRQIKARTRHFAKRQLTWFKRMPIFTGMIRITMITNKD